MELINDLKKEKTIFFKYCKAHKLFGGFIFLFIILFIIKLIVNICLKDSSVVLNMLYNVFLGLSMSALFYYWIEYKRKYEIVNNNKIQIQNFLERIEKNIEEAYKKPRMIRAISYNREFDEIEKLIEITFSYEWFNTHYIRSVMTMKKSIYYEIFKGSFENCAKKEHEKKGDSLYKKIGKEFYKIIFSLEEMKKLNDDKPLEEANETLEEMKISIKNKINKDLDDQTLEEYSWYIREESIIICSFTQIISGMKEIVLRLEI